MRVSRRTCLLAAGASASAAPATFRLPRRIRLGLIGLDGHPDEITRVLPSFPDVVLAAVAVANSDPAAVAGARRSPAFANVRWYAAAEQMLQAEKLDIAAVCNNDGERAAAVLACIGRGLPVIAEKPLAVTRSDFNRVAHAVEKENARVGMLLPMRFDPPYVAMQRLVSSGAIGEVLQIDAQKSYKLGSRPAWQKNARTYGSTILWIGIHMIDLMAYTSGRAFVEAASLQSRVKFPELGDMQNVTATIFRLDNGGTGTLRMDYLRPASAPTHGDDRLRLAGTRGVLEYTDSTGLTLIAGDAPPRTITDLPAARSVFADFLESVFLGKAPLLPWRDIRNANEWTLGADEAASAHRFVSLT